MHEWKKMLSFITLTRNMYFHSAVFLALVCVLSCCRAVSVKVSKFVKYSGKVLPRDGYQNFTVTSSVVCYGICFEEGNCESASFDTVTKTCNLTTVPNLAVRSVANSQSHSDVFGKEGKS